MFYLVTHSTHFYLQLYGIGHIVKDHSDSEKGNPLSDQQQEIFYVPQFQRQDSIRQPLLQQSWSTGWKEK